MWRSDRRRWCARGLAAGAAAGAVAVGLLGPSPAAVAVPSCPVDRPLTAVQVSTVPVVPGARIIVDGVPVVTDAAGHATATVCRLVSARDITGPSEPIALAGYRRAVFDRVFISDRGQVLQVAFGMETEVALQFYGLPTKQIESYTLRSSTGEVITRRTLDPLYLPSQRVLRGPDGLEERKIYYSVDSVYVAGSSVVNRSQVKFFPADTTLIRVPLLVYSVRIEVVDRLFRWPVGESVRLTRPNAPDLEARLVDGVATYSAVPRGEYSVVADAAGVRIDRTLILTRNQIVVMPVLSWLDLVTLIGLPVLIAVGLVLAPRPRLRRRLATPFARALVRVRGLVRRKANSAAGS